jgi:acyl-CoA synthetase (AMP-forming)/AMP-acid ligase II
MTAHQGDAKTLLHWLDHWAATTPDKLAAETLEDGRLTYGALRDKAHALAAALLDRGLRPGDHIAIQLPSYPEFLVTYFAACRAGLILTTMHVPYRYEELKPLMEFSGARAVVTAQIGQYDGPETMRRLRDAVPSLEMIIVVGQDAPESADSFDALVAAGDAASLPPPPSAETKCTLCFTSGTSAAPKGVRRVQRLMAENAEKFAAMIEMTSDDRVMIAPPLTHVFGLLCAGNTIRSGATVLPLPLFTPPAYVDFLTKLAPTVIYSAPAHLAATLKSGVLDQHSPTSVRDVIVGGSICPPAVARDFEAKLPNGRVGCLFGMTEALLATQTDIHGRPDMRHGTVGTLAPGLEVRIADPEGNPQPQGESGEFQLKGYSILAEYEGNPAATEASFTEDGWFKSGDLAYLDADGNIIITGRVKDIINRGGIKINPADIESLLDGHERIVQSALVPMPDDVLGERICLYATLTPGDPLTLEEVCAYLDARGIAKMRWPERLEIIEEMPMTPTKKITKAVLVTDIRTKMSI